MERTSLGDVSTPGRVAAAGEGISEEELALAARNHGLPLEALRYDVTPPGLHYVLVHYDIPARRARAGGSRRRTVRTPLKLGLRNCGRCRRHPGSRWSARATAAPGSPRPVSQPWLVEAVGTADWTGRTAADAARGGRGESRAVEAVFTGADHGVERGVEQDYRRSLPVAVATGRDRRSARVRDERRARCPPSTATRCGSSSPAGTAWPREVAPRHRTHRRPVHRVPAGRGLPLPAGPRRPRRARHPDRPARPADPARASPTSCRARGSSVRDPCAGGPRLVRHGAGHSGRGQRRRRPHLERCRTRPARPAPLGWRPGTRRGPPRPATTSSPSGPPTPTATPSRSSSPGTAGLREQPRPACSGPVLLTGSTDATDYRRPRTRPGGFPNRADASCPARAAVRKRGGIRG